MSSANAGWFLSPLHILLPLLTLPFLLVPEANLINSTTNIPNTTVIELEQPMTTSAYTVAYVSTSMAKAEESPLPTVIVAMVEEPATGGQEIMSQGPETTSTMTGPATLQRSENHTEAETTTGSRLDATSHLPEPKAAGYFTEDPVTLNSTRVELTLAAIDYEATTPYATPTFTTNANTTPGLAAATTTGSQILLSSEASVSETPLTTGSVAPDASTPTRPPYSTTFSSVTTPPSPSSFPPIRPDSRDVWSTQPTQTALIPITNSFDKPTVGPQRFPIPWIIMVVLLAVVVFMGAVCLGLWVKRRRRRSRVLQLGSHGYSYRKNKGKEADAWAGPVTISTVAATATAREETEGEAKGEEEEKNKGGGDDDVLLSTFGVEGTGSASPNGRRGVGRLGSTEARKWEEESPLLFIDEDQVVEEAKAGANNLEGGGGGEEEENEKEKANEKEKEKDGKGLNGNEQTNGGIAFCYITAV